MRKVAAPTPSPSSPSACEPAGESSRQISRYFLSFTDAHRPLGQQPEVPAAHA